MTDIVERLRERHQLINHEAADTIEHLRARIAEMEGHLGRVLHRYSGAWHPDSIFQKEYGHEIEAARAAIRQRTGQ